MGTTCSPPHASPVGPTSNLAARWIAVGGTDQNERTITIWQTECNLNSLACALTANIVRGSPVGDTTATAAPAANRATVGSSPAGEQWRRTREQTDGRHRICAR